LPLTVPALYSDINASLAVNPVTGDIAQLDNVESIRASILNILRTRKGERLFQPELGTNIHKMLFEPNTPFTAGLIKQELTTSITKQEPRVVVEKVEVEAFEDNYGVKVFILCRIKDTTEEVEIEDMLERGR
jgi:phage baseplate assembly protein W